MPPVLAAIGPALGPILTNIAIAAAVAAIQYGIQAPLPARWLSVRLCSTPEGVAPRGPAVRA